LISDDGGAGGGGGQIAYPVLTASNYVTWSIRVQAIMEDQGVWGVVEPPPSAPGEATAPQTPAEAKLDKKARAHLLQCLPDDLLMAVAGKKTGKEVWDTLKARFVGEQGVKEARLQTLKGEFDALQMKDDESVDVYAGKLSGMAVRYGNLGGSLDDTALVKKLFDTVPERFINVVAGIEQICNLSTLTFADAVGRLKTFKERTRRVSGSSRTDSSGQLLLTQAEWDARQKRVAGEGSGKKSEGASRGRGRGRGGGRGTGGREGTGKRDKSHIQCFKCKNYGHYANKCPGEKKGNEAHHTQVDTEPALMLAVTEEVVLSENLQSEVQK